MGKGKSPRRYCEECGRVIESKHPGVTLCRLCEERAAEALRNQGRKRRKERDRVRDLEEGFYLPGK